MDRESKRDRAGLQEVLARMQLLEGALTRCSAAEPDVVMRELVLAERDTIAGSRRRLRAQLLERADVALTDTAPALLRVGPVEVDQAARDARVAGETVNLTPKEFDLLAVLAGEPQRVWTKELLLQRVWGWDPTTTPTRTRTVNQHAASLRRKLGLGAGWVVSSRGVGFRLRSTSTRGRVPDRPRLEAVAG